MANKNKTPGSDKETAAPVSDNKNSALEQQEAILNSTKPAADSAQAKQAEMDKKSAPSEPAKKGGQGLAVLAILIALGSAGGLYYQGMETTKQYNSELARITNELNTTRKALADSQSQTQSALQTGLKTLQRDTEVLLEQQQTSLTSLQSALAGMKGRRPNDWLLAEADHLINQAGRQLWIEGDITTATRLIQTADQRVAALNDPSLTPVRKALSQDLQALKSIQRIDIDGIVLRLTGIQQQIAQMPLANAILPIAEETKAPEVSTQVSDWKENLKASLTEFADQFITYRKREGSVIPLLTPAQTFYVQENLKAKIDQAITAVYRHNEALYTQALQVAIDWIVAFYDQSSPVTLGVLDSLAQLKQQPINVEYPKQLASQPIITDLLAEKLRRNLVAPLDVDNLEGK